METISFELLALIAAEPLPSLAPRLDRKEDLIGLVIEPKREPRPGAKWSGLRSFAFQKLYASIEDFVE